MKISRYLPDRNRSLLPYQRPALTWMLKRNNPALYIDMRLGKTLLSIEWCIRKKLKRILVLCPKTSLGSWRDELTLEGIIPSILDTRKLKQKATLQTTEGWTITNFQAILFHPLHLAKWDTIIIDECQVMKNPKADFTKKLQKYYSDIPYKILLSGTPTPETITESITQLIFKDGDCLGCKSYWHFRAKYMIVSGYDWILRHGVYEQLKARLHKTAYFLTQKAAGWDTTEKREVVKFKMNSRQKKYTKELLRDFETEIDGKKYETKYILPRTIWRSKVASGYIGDKVINPSKHKWLLNYFKSNPGKQYIVWFNFNEELFAVEKCLQKAGINAFALYGDVKSKDRMVIQTRFKNKEIDVLLIQTALGRYSLNLSSANAAIYFSNAYSCEKRAQSEKRISHVHRKTPPHYIDLVFQDSIEIDLLEMIKTKYFSFRFLWRSNETIV